MCKPKIAFVLPALNTGGAQRVVTSLANSLIGDYQVYLITFTSEPSFYRLNENIKHIYCVGHIKPSENIIQALKSNYVLFKTIKDYVKKEKINLLIGFLTSANVLSIIAAKISGIPVIISERNNPNLDKASRLWRFLRNCCYPMANFIIVQTETIRKFYIRKIKKDRLIIMPNPIATTLTSKRDNKIAKENIILNVGRLTNQKGQDILIKAFSKTINNNDWRLVIAGEGPNRSNYEKLVEKLDLKERVALLGNYKEIYNLYNKARIFSFSSIYEGFPNALIEAMHYGLACISTNCPTGPSELINDGENGYLIMVNDEQEMAKKLQILMNNEEKRTVFGEKAVKSVEKFEMNNVILQWKNIIDMCLSKNGTLIKKI